MVRGTEAVVTDMPLTGEYAPSPSDWAREQAETYEATNGAEGNLLRGVPIVVYTSVGASSGKLRKTPLMRVEHGGQYLAVASKGGAPDHPAWYRNFLTSPFVEVQDGAQRLDCSVRELEGAEREEWWARSLEVWPDYAEYQRTTERLIPLLLLTPLDRSGA
jgi:F420H(2)-dependent quinone reductase